MSKPEIEFAPITDIPYTLCPGDNPLIKERILASDPVGGVAVLVEHADLAAVFGEAPADGAADRAAAAGDDDVLF